MLATLQLCTYNRAPLLERVLDACFEQSVPQGTYEIVLVDDGSTDETPAVIERARARATCPFIVVTQPNSGLAKGRNAGISRASGEQIVFIDDDVLVLPNFVEEHLCSHAAHPSAIVRGGAINVESFDDLPPPVWSVRNYSGNYFWTTNVSVPLAQIRSISGFDESFSEYGWEDIDVGLRLRFAGIKAVFNPKALVYHFKPPLRAGDIARALAQARAQARTAVQLVRRHPHWRSYLATGIDPVQLRIHATMRKLHVTDRLRTRLGDLSNDRVLDAREARAARALIREAYYDELARALES